MKVLAFNGSPHRNGTTAQALEIIAGELEKEEVSLEIVNIGVQPIRGCMACMKCRELSRCVYHDDPVNECLEKAKTADGLIVASPVYYSGISGTLKCFLDRFFYAGPDLKFKAAAAVTALRRSGGVPAFHQINNYFNLAQMVITPGIYWNAIHGTSGEEAKEDHEGGQILRYLGRNMAWLMKTLAAGREAVPVPKGEKRVKTNFIH